MRSAVAHFEDDDEVFETSRKRAPKRGKSGAKRKKQRSRWFALDLDMQKVARYGAIGMSVIVATGIMVNALVMQKTRHPAPLFGSTVAIEEPAAPKVPPKMALAETTAAPAPPAPAAQPQPAPKDAPPSSGRKDLIAHLIEGGTVPADRSRTVTDTQRALAKLGYALKPTGNFGPQTKKAIERFEKEHHLPVKGEMSRKVIKLLSSASGLKIEQ